ncbi:hypothetical protein IAQ61_011075 [Plenodomus lingam]|uniref:uncharacterized protein n=1 Tax=Leptosphaeria maculans TaxID=5022 RepID=UPI003331B954|nr:hypothetical protein IAQ61_011075 [Plenodomus lingam]
MNLFWVAVLLLCSSVSGAYHRRCKCMNVMPLRILLMGQVFTQPVRKLNQEIVKQIHAVTTGKEENNQMVASSNNNQQN